MDKKKEVIEIKIFEVFAGIGSQKKALEKIANKMNYKIISVGQIEWFVDAIIGYISINVKTKNIRKEKLKKDFYISFDSKKKACKNNIQKINNSKVASYLNLSSEICKNFFDINNVKGKDIPKEIDIFTYSFPCQDLSIQGKQLGMDKKNKTRSGLLWEVGRILEEMKDNFSINQMPKYLLLENVQNITSKKHIKSYNLWLKKLKDLGYESKTYKLNSSHFGSAQNRIRTFCISIRKDYMDKINFLFPEFNCIKNNKKIKDILENKIEEKFYLDKLLKYERTKEKKTKNGIIKSELIDYTNFKSEAYIYNINGLGPTLTASGANSRIKIIDGNRIRMMSPVEAIKYMGFSKKDYLKIKNTNLISDNKIIYLAGNSIPIQILEKIFLKLKFEKKNECN